MRVNGATVPCCACQLQVLRENILYIYYKYNIIYHSDASRTPDASIVTSGSTGCLIPKKVSYLLLLKALRKQR